METNQIIQGVSLTAIAGGLTWVANKAGVEGKWLPLTSLLCGVVVSCLATWTLTGDVILTGVIAGLTASGAYDHIQSTKEIVKGE